MDCVYVIKFRHFLNNLLNTENVRYLEIGQWNNSSICSAMCNNRSNIVCIEYAYPNTRDPLTSYEQCIKSSKSFLTNFSKFNGENNITFLAENCFSIDVSRLPKSNVFMYDGDKYCKNIYNILIHYYSCLQDTFIFCINTLSYKYINDNVQNAILTLKLKKLYEHDLVFWNEDLSVCNNFYIVILQK